MEKEQYYQLLKDYLHLVALYLNKKEATDFKIDESNIGFFVDSFGWQSD